MSCCPPSHAVRVGLSDDLREERLHGWLESTIHLPRNEPFHRLISFESDDDGKQVRIRKVSPQPSDDRYEHPPLSSGVIEKNSWSYPEPADRWYLDPGVSPTRPPLERSRRGSRKFIISYDRCDSDRIPDFTLRGDLGAEEPRRRPKLQAHLDDGDSSRSPSPCRRRPRRERRVTPELMRRPSRPSYGVLDMEPRRSAQLHLSSPISNLETQEPRRGSKL